MEGAGARGARLAPSGCSWAAFEETAKDYGTGGRADRDAVQLGFTRGKVAGGRGPEICVALYEVCLCSRIWFLYIPTYPTSIA